MFIGGRKDQADTSDLFYVYDSVVSDNPAQGIYGANGALMADFIDVAPDYSTWPTLGAVQSFTRVYGTQGPKIAGLFGGFDVASRVDSGVLSIVKLAQWAISSDDYGITGLGFAGVADDMAAPLFPVIEASGTIDEAYVPALTAAKIPAATPSAVGGVLVDLNAAGSPAEVPAIDSGGFISRDVLPEADVDLMGGVVVVGTPAPGVTKVPCLTSVNVPVDATITTASLVGKTIRVENGIITGFS
jgi:hypothetical protein